jgi:hypothetical protein
MLAQDRSMTIAETYLTAREAVVAAGYGAEIDWQESRSLAALSESDFLEEFAWVVLSSGMKEAVVRRLFPRISQAFLEWRSAAAIVRRRRSCQRRAIRVFNHRPKIDAVLSAAKRVADLGFSAFRNQIQRGGIDFIRTLAFMGPATSYHLAKNIGLDVVKPDRHLVRIAESAGGFSPNDLCEMIAHQTGDKVSVIDIVLWRYATLNRQEYRGMFAQ